MLHLRYTPYDISGYTFDFLDSLSSRYIVAQEDIDDEGKPLLHYHILIDTDYGTKSIRDAAKESLKIPAVGRGKNNKYYALIEDWQDPSYICKYYNIIRSKGYDEKTLLDYAVAGKAKYLNKKTLERNSNVMTVEIVKPKTPPVDRLVSTEILAWYYEYETEHGSEPTKRQIVEKACELYRGHGKGINVFKIREIVHTLWYDVNSTRDKIVSQILSLC